MAGMDIRETKWKGKWREQCPARFQVKFAREEKSFAAQSEEETFVWAPNGSAYPTSAADVDRGPVRYTDFLSRLKELGLLTNG